MYRLKSGSEELSAILPKHMAIMLKQLKHEIMFTTEIIFQYLNIVFQIPTHLMEQKYTFTLNLLTRIKAMDFFRDNIHERFYSVYRIRTDNASLKINVWVGRAFSTLKQLVVLYVVETLIFKKVLN